MIWISLIFSLLSFFVYKTDTFLRYQYLTLGLHLISILLALTYFVKLNRKCFKLKNHYKYLLILSILTMFFHFINLKTYPFVSVGDEVRDGGLNAVEINQGDYKDIFGYGRYESHGLIIPTINSVFVKLFPQSNLLYRVPTAIVGSLDVLLFYLLISLSFNSTIAFWSALILVTQPLHLFYSRTETVIIFSSLLSSLLIGLFLATLNKTKKPINYITLFIIMGFSFNFHASIKAVAIVLIPYAIIKILSLKKISSIILSLFLLPISLVAGFGPRLFSSPFSTLFHTSRINQNMDLSSLLNNYWQSLKVIAFSPTASHFPDHQPLLAVSLFILFLIGLVYLYSFYRQYFYLLIYLILVIPFTNSAFTDIVNADHRLIPLIPILAILSGLGIFALINYSSKFIALILKILFYFYLITNALLFFYKQSANINDYTNFRQSKDYLSMHLIYLIKQNPTMSQSLCVLASPYNAINYNYLHYQEQYDFFIPQKTLDFVSNQSVFDSELLVFPDDCSQTIDRTSMSHYQVLCSDGENKLKCPLGYKGGLSIYY